MEFKRTKEKLFLKKNNSKVKYNIYPIQHKKKENSFVTG
jgi:hypothetical protein